MRIWRGIVSTWTMPSTRNWDCRWGLGWSKVLVSGSSNNASKGLGCGGVRTVSTTLCISGLPGSTDASRPCSSWPYPQTRKCALLGPLRKPIVRYYQNFSHNDLLRTNIYPIFPNVDTDQLVNRVKEIGYAHVGNLPEEYITQILDYCEINKQTSYWNPHIKCEAVDRICRNAKIVE